MNILPNTHFEYHKFILKVSKISFLQERCSHTMFHALYAPMEASAPLL